MLVRIIVFAILSLAAVAMAQPAPSAPAAPRPASARVLSMDRVVAVVNDEAVTQYELEEAKRIVTQQLKQQKVQEPPADVLDKQVLERLVTEHALLQFAKENGIKVDDNQVERKIGRAH